MPDRGDISAADSARLRVAPLWPLFRRKDAALPDTARRDRQPPHAATRHGRCSMSHRDDIITIYFIAFTFAGKSSPPMPCRR